MKARKIGGVWKLKELGFSEDFDMSGKHLAEVDIGLGNYLNLTNGEIVGRGSGKRRVFLDQGDGIIFALDLNVKNESESRIQGMAIMEILDGNHETIILNDDKSIF